MERDVQRGSSGTAMTLQFGFRGGPTTVNRMAVTYLYRIITHLFASLENFDVLLFYNNDYYLVYQLAAMIPFMPIRLYKRHDLS